MTASDACLTKRKGHLRGHFCPYLLCQGRPAPLLQLNPQCRRPQPTGSPSRCPPWCPPRSRSATKEMCCLTRLSHWRCPTVLEVATRYPSRLGCTNRISQEGKNGLSAAAGVCRCDRCESTTARRNRTGHFTRNKSLRFPSAIATLPLTLEHTITALAKHNLEMIAHQAMRCDHTYTRNSMHAPVFSRLENFSSFSGHP